MKKLSLTLPSLKARDFWFIEST